MLPMTPNSDLAQEYGRTIGNGVVLAYGFFAAATAALAGLGHLDATLAVGVTGAAFVLVFVGDHHLQFRDMERGTAEGSNSSNAGD